MTSIILKVSSLKGGIQTFNVPANTTVEDFKRTIYHQHDDINKPFPVEEIHKLEIQLTCQGKTLQDHQLVSEIVCPSSDTLYVSVKSKPVSISPKTSKVTPVSNSHNLLDEYIISPAKSDHSKNWASCEKSQNISVPRSDLREISRSLTRISKELSNLAETIERLQNPATR